MKVKEQGLGSTQNWKGEVRVRRDAKKAKLSNLEISKKGARETGLTIGGLRDALAKREIRLDGSFRKAQGCRKDDGNAGGCIVPYANEAKQEVGHSRSYFNSVDLEAMRCQALGSTQLPVANFALEMLSPLVVHQNLLILELTVTIEADNLDFLVLPLLFLIAPHGSSNLQTRNPES